ncbi:MAG: histidine kinase [Archangium gephyra]|uniref:histidine kinase n=1 Tax=Archangium gephyra TaxID=48 RepID=A0A2W5TKN5_9BACT|nr:MAG: histidine kinase [Archangium gephyra]
MNRLTLWVWGSFIGIGAGTLLITSNVFAAVAIGAVSAACVYGATQRVAAQWKRRADAFAAAARGLAMDPLVDVGPGEDPIALAREVHASAVTARDNARKLGVLAAVIDGMAEGVWITAEDGTILEHNNALKELLYTAREVVGHRPRDLFPNSPEMQQATERACRDGVASRIELNVEGVRPTVLSVHVSPLGREVGGSSAVFFDVSELRRLEKVRKDFVANVSHELRTPITAIRGYAETLQSGAINDAVAAPKMVDIIHRQSERLSELVEDLLELSRIEARQIQLEEKPVDVLDATQRAFEAVRPKASPRSTTLHSSVPAGLKVLGDKRALEQIMLNLVDNAVKYTRPGGRVEVTAERRDDAVLIRVKDDGPGIEARHLSRVFERFYRVDKGRSRDMGGTGLGLSIVKNLANTMKGDVRVESTPGNGSSFFVELPVPPES